MLSTVEKLLFLKGIDLFQKLSNEDLVQIAQIAEEVHFEREEPLIVEGDMGDALFITVAGHVRISKEGKQLNELGDGEVLGEMGILDSAPRSASVTAIDDVTALKLERDAFHELMSERQEIAQGIIHVLLHRLRALSQIKADEIQQAKGTPTPSSPNTPAQEHPPTPEDASPESHSEAPKEPTAEADEQADEADAAEVAEVAEAMEAAGLDAETAVELAAEASPPKPTRDGKEHGDTASSEVRDASEANDAANDTDVAVTPKGATTSSEASDAAVNEPLEGRERSKPTSPREHDGEDG